MKRKLLILIYLFAFNIAVSQITLIPDPNFEQALIDQNYDDVLNGSVLTSNIQDITFLNLTGADTFEESLTAPGLGITDLTGIKAFTSLDTLWVQQNNLTILDVEDMTNITDIRAFFNDLEQININGLTNLEIIGLNVNKLSGINVSTNTNLKIFDVAQNELLGLDISSLANLTNMNVQDNAQLTCIQVESATRATSLNGNTNFRKNGSTTFSNTCTTIYTQIPDRNFEQSLIDQNIDSEGGIANGLVLTSDISGRISLDISGQDITDLSGLEDFTALEILNVNENNLNALRLQNLNLVEIYANNTNVPLSEIRFQNNPPNGDFLTNVVILELQDNNLGAAGSTINFGGLPNLQSLNVSGNNFGNINLSTNTSITNLIASNCGNLNTITALSDLAQLQELTVDNSDFTTLNFSGLNVLSTLRINTNNFTSLNLKDIDDTLTTLNTTENSNLNCIEVNNVANAEAQGNWQKDTNTEYLTDCSGPTPILVRAVLNTTTAPYSTNEGGSFEISFQGEYGDGVDNPTINIDYTTTGSTATLGEDFIIPGTIEVTLNNDPNPDPNVLIQIPMDYYNDPNETIQINFPPNPNYQWVNAESDGSVSFIIPITNVAPTDPLVISATLENAGTDPYTVTEGNSFALNFNAINPPTAAIGENFIVPYTTNNLTEDFTVNTTQGLFEVSNQNPNGSLTFTATSDTNPNENESININLPPPTDYFSWVGASGDGSVEFDVTIEDNSVQNDLLQVEASLGGGEGDLTNYSIIEGDILRISFNLLSTVTEDQEFPVVYQISGSAQTEDYILPPNPGTLAISTFNSYAGGLSFEIINDFPSQELGETIIVTLPKPNSGYEWVNAETDGSLRFEINITDSSSYNEPEFEVALIGNTEFIDGIYYITEGDALEFWIESNTLNNDQEMTYELTTDIVSFSGNAELGIDYTTTTLPLQFQVNNNINPDTKISIETIDDNFRNEPKDIILTIYGFGEVPFPDATTDNPIRYFIRVKDNDNAESSISAILDNTGSLEGGANDEFTLSLTNSDGTPYLAEENLTFNISFSPTEGPNGEKPADIGDFIPVNDETQIIIPQGFSKGKIEVELPIETGSNEDDVPEYYVATLTNVTSENFILSEPLLVKILDPGTKFKIFLTAFTTNPINEIYKGDAIFSNPSSCCPTYTIEEGASFKVGFEAEKGVPLNSNYSVITSFSELGEGGNEGNVTAEEGVDYQNKNPNNTATYISKTEIPDNVLQIDIFSDQDEQGNGTEILEDKEYFFLSITLDESDKDEYTLVNVEEASGQPAFPSNAEIFITQVTHIIIPQLTYEVTEIDSETNIVRVKVSVDRDVFIGSLEVDYQLSGTAIEGDDYEIIGSRSIVFEDNKDAFIDIQVLNDDEVENAEQIEITLIDGRGYSINNNSNRAIVTIPKNDQDLINYTVTLTANQSQISENPGSNEGIFNVTLAPENTSGSNVVVNYAFIDNGELNPAIEGENNDFTQSGNGQLIFESNSLSTQQIIVTALEDPDEGPEPPETITLSLLDGNQYSSGNTDVVSMEILSTEVDREQLREDALTIEVLSNSCSNFSEGNIIIKNKSPFAFLVTITKEDGEEITFPLNEFGKGESGEEEIENLPSGRYLVSFALEDESLDFIPPSFEIFIEELSGTSLKAQSVDFSAKTAQLKVSGSRNYLVTNDDKEYIFDGQGFGETFITVPLHDGLNKLKIKGEAACQGTLETTVYLRKLLMYPNPTQKKVTVNGFLKNEEAKISITNLSGKVVYKTTLKIMNNGIELDLSGFPSAVYLVKVITESEENIEFKLLKN